MDWSNILSGFIGAAGAIGVYYLGTSRDRKRERKSESEKDFATLAYLKVSLEKTMETLDLYIKVLDKFVKDIKDNPIVFPEADYYAFPYAERLSKKVDQNNVFIAIRNKYELEDAVKIFTNIYRIIDNINYLIPAVYVEQGKAIEEDFIRKKEYKSIVGICMDDIARLGLTSNQKYTITFKEDVLRILEKFTHKEKWGNLNYYQENFVEDLKGLLIKIGIDEKLDLINMLGKLRSATTIYEFIKDQNTHHSKLIFRYKEQLSELLKSLHDVLTKLEDGS